jgi:hypothetical protein
MEDACGSPGRVFMISSTATLRRPAADSGTSRNVHARSTGTVTGAPVEDADTIIRGVRVAATAGKAACGVRGV